MPNTVNLVRSLDEARQLEPLGIQVVGAASLDGPPAWRSRAATDDELLVLRRGCAASFALGISATMPSDRISSLVDHLAPDRVELGFQELAKLDDAQKRALADIPLTLSGFGLDEDHDPLWIRHQIADYRRLCSTCDTAIVTLFPSFERPLEWLLTEAGKYPEDVTLDDVESFFSDTATLCNCRIDRASALPRLLYRTGQLAFYLGDESSLGCPSFVTFESLTSTLTELRGAAEASPR